MLQASEVRVVVVISTSLSCPLLQLLEISTPLRTIVAVSALLSRFARILTFVSPVIADEGVNVNVPPEAAAHSVSSLPSKAFFFPTLLLYVLPETWAVQLLSSLGT